MMDQHAEAERFIAEHGDELETTVLTALAAGKRFLAGAAGKVFNAEEQAAAQAALDKRDLNAFYRLFRLRSSEFAASARDSFWGMVDALNFLHDATSTHWPYLTQAKRLQYLAWSRQDAALVR